MNDIKGLLESIELLELIRQFYEIYCIQLEEDRELIIAYNQENKVLQSLIVEFMDRFDAIDNHIESVNIYNLMQQKFYQMRYQDYRRVYYNNEKDDELSTTGFVEIVGRALHPHYRYLRDFLWDYNNNIGIKFCDHLSMKQKIPPKYFGDLNLMKACLEIASYLWLEAEDSLGKCLKTYKSDLEIGYVYKLLGIVYEKLNKLDNASESYRKSLDLREKKLGGINMDIVDVYERLATLLNRQSHHPLSNMHCLKALRVLKCTEDQQSSRFLKMLSVGFDNFTVMGYYENAKSFGDGLAIDSFINFDTAFELEHDNPLDIIMQKIDTSKLLFEKFGCINKCYTKQIIVLFIKFLRKFKQYYGLANILGWCKFSDLVIEDVLEDNVRLDLENVDQLHNVDLKQRLLFANSSSMQNSGL